MADINHIITLGIGTPGDIEHFILLGLTPFEPSAEGIGYAITGFKLHYELKDDRLHYAVDEKSKLQYEAKL